MCTGAAASTPVTGDGGGEDRDRGRPVEFELADVGPGRQPGRPENPGRAADAPGAARSQALRLLMDLDLPSRGGLGS